MSKSTKAAAGNAEVQKKRVGFFRSLSFKIMILVIISVAISNFFSLAIIYMNCRTQMRESTKGSMLDMAEAYGSLLNYELSKGVELPVDAYQGILGGVALTGAEDSYLYVTDKNGLMIYHPDSSRIGTQVENSMINQLIQDIKSGSYAETDVVIYDYHGSIKYASYIVLSDMSVLVVSADEEQVLSGIHVIFNIVIASSLSMQVIFAVLAFFFSKIVTRPIKQLTEVIEQTANLDFRANEKARKLLKRTDETGAMAQAVSDMRVHLRDMVGDINTVSHQITSNVDELKVISGSINSMCTDNSATTEELAAGMQETAATTETINNSIGYMQTGAADIKTLSVEGESTSEEIMRRAAELSKTTEEASVRTTEIYSDVKIKTEEAIEKSKAVDKINELTEAIMSISSQTSLLALNASIEAARAGEAGRGFSVVATEIGNLANQTSQTVGDINSIVQEVNEAVSNMSSSLHETIDFLENVVIKDYDQFKEVSIQYSSDAAVVRKSMETIEEAVSNLTDTIAEIAESLNGINATVNESTIGVTDIATKTTDVVSQTVQNNELVDDCLDSVDKLKEIAARFVLDQK